MIDRRELLSLGGLLGGLSSSGITADGTAYGIGEMSDKSAQDIVTALRAISTAVAAAQSFDAIGPIRARQIEYLKATNKFPDFIDVGVDMWMAVYDWHIRLQQPLALGRDPNGRYLIAFGFTQLVLRPDSTATFISPPYDNR
jgi:hypothetical protein